MQNKIINLFILGVCFASLQSCKTTQPSAGLSTQNVRGTATPQWVIKPRMIFKFYCKPEEKLPDCEEYDVMRVSSFAKAVGFSYDEIEELRNYTDGLKPYKQNIKKLSELEAGYKNAVSKNQKITKLQMDQYKFQSEALKKEIARFEKLPNIAWNKIQYALNDKAKREQYFRVEGGEIDSGNEHTCALRLDGKLLCWGSNEYGQINGHKALIASGDLRLPIRSISAGDAHNCAIGSEQSFACWGSDFSRQSTGFTNPEKRSAELKFPVLAVSASTAHTCAIGSEQSFACWGRDGWGESKGYMDPKKLSAELKFPVLAVSTGAEHTCAIGSDQTFACWGDDFFGKINGYLDRKNRSAELKFPVLAVSSSEAHTCAIGADQSFACWGDNSEGQSKGYMEPEKRSAELKFPVLAVSAGGKHTCAIGSEQSFACWGLNVLREMRLVTTGQRDGYMEPQNRSAVLKFPVLAVSAGDEHTCAIGSDRKISCWGNNNYGQVNGRDANGYQLGDDLPEHFATTLFDLGYYDDVE